MIPVPGHPFPGAVDFENRLSYDAGPYTDTNVFTDAGEPTVAIALHVYVAAGVVMGASTISSSAMTFEGFVSGSVITLDNRGTIEGAGGLGGNGQMSYSGSTSTVAGGGGGGAGTVGGVGGFGDDNEYPATMGVDGSSGTLGAAGIGDQNSTLIRPDPFVGISNGGLGGDAITLGDADVSIYNNLGFIWSGGGGGGGGYFTLGPFAFKIAGDGGDNGEYGDDSDASVSTGGAPGYAVRYAGTGQAVFLAGGSTPEKKGLVGTG